ATAASSSQTHPALPGFPRLALAAAYGCRVSARPRDDIEVTFAPRARWPAGARGAPAEGQGARGRPGRHATRPAWRPCAGHRWRPGAAWRTAVGLGACTGRRGEAVVTVPAMPRGPRLVQLPAITVVGLRVTAPFRELFTAVPAAWREVFARAGEL